MQTIWEQKFFPRVFLSYRQQPSPLLNSIEIRADLNSRKTEPETNYYIALCASMFACSCCAGILPKQLLTDLFMQHQGFVVCCPLSKSEFLPTSQRYC